MIKIVTDSSITIPKEVVEDLAITVVPLSVLIDDILYSDADLKEEGKFLGLMKEAANLPKTSQPPVGVFSQVYEDLAVDGSEIISIHMSHALSGTVEAARQGASISGAKVSIVDSSFTDQAMKFQVVRAAEMARDGKGTEEILAELDRVRENTKLYIGVSTLENLVKGGRIGRVTGLLSSLLNIRVMMEMKDHELSPIVKGRGLKTFKKWVADLQESLKVHPAEEIAISYAGTADFANWLKEELQAYSKQDIPVLETGSIIQTHTGEDAFAVLIRYQ